MEKQQENFRQLTQGKSQVKPGGNLGKTETGKGRVKQMCSLKKKKSQKAKRTLASFPKATVCPTSKCLFRGEEGDFFTGEHLLWLRGWGWGRTCAFEA